METEEVPAGPDSAAPADGVQDGEAPYFREAALAGEVREEEADADVSLSFSS